MGRLVLLLGLLLAAAACGGGTTETVTVTGTPQSETTTVTVTLEPEPTISTTAPALKTPTFQMPSKDIGCATSEGVLVCDILSGLKPEPKQTLTNVLIDAKGDTAQVRIRNIMQSNGVIHVIDTVLLPG